MLDVFQLLILREYMLPPSFHPVLRQGPNMRIQSGFMPGGLVFVDDALVYHRVNDRHGGLVGRFGRCPVFSLDGIDDFFDPGAQPGTLTGIVQTVFSACRARFLADAILATL